MFKKILVVEDDVQISDLMRRYISSVGYEVDVIKNGYKLFDTLDSGEYGMIFMDVLMPGQTGLELLKELKKDEKYKNIPVVMLSNVVDQVKMDEAMVCGAAEYLIKVNTDLNKVREVLERLG